MNPRAGLGLCGYVDRPGRIGFPIHGQGTFDPINLFAVLEQAIGGDEGIVDLVVEQVPGGLRRRARCDRCGFGKTADLLEWAVETIEYPVELDPHLVGQCPAGVVVWRNRRAARILQIVRMILRLEHIQNVRAKCLCGHDDVGTGRIALAAGLEIRGRSMDGHPGLDQRIDEFDGGQEIRLIRRDDVSARITVFGLAQHLVIFDWDAAIEPGQSRDIRLRLRRLPATLTALPPIFVDCRLNLGQPPGIDRPAIATAALDRVPSHAIDVQEKVFTVLGGDIQNRAVGCQRILDRLSEMPFLGLDREGKFSPGQLSIDDERDLHRRRVAD